MKLEPVTIRNFRAIKDLTLPLDPSLTVFFFLSFAGLLRVTMFAQVSFELTESPVRAA